MKKIIVDTLGSDFGDIPIIKGALRALSENPSLFLVFVGNSSSIKAQIQESDADSSRIEILDTDEFVSDDALPTCVFKGCDNTSMVMALSHLKDTPDSIGMICAGNTGALLVGSICRLGLVPGLKSPALATAIPVKEYGSGLVCLTDCGANTQCTPSDLKRFALMGNAFIKCLTGISDPKVALMSVGRSSHKGNDLIKEAYPLISQLPINFIGNIEGCDLINSEADVIVTDGFTGNILLKNTEACGMAALSAIDLFGELSDAFTSLKNNLKKMFSFNDRGGATFLGTKKTIVKMHGCANENTAYACINQVLDLESRNFSAQISDAVLLSQK